MSDEPEDAWSPEARMARLPDPALEPHPLHRGEYEALMELKAELWGGMVDGPYRDVWLKTLLVNAGVRRAIQLAPLAVWHQALREAERHE